jgi:cellulose synthase/poly-beta-1,6-N-acetylglucosamine synthase-like glycosyltransferase
MAERKQGVTASLAGVRGASIHLVIALVSLIVLAVAQLFVFTQAGGQTQHGAGPAHFASTVAGGAVLLFTLTLLLRQAVLMSLAYGGAVRSARRRFEQRPSWPGVSILVPAYNEGGRVAKAIEAILALDYPALEVIVVDDGSTDDTSARAAPYVGVHGSKRVSVLRKENGGKWSALNLAFHHASHELIVCVDADSQLAPDSLKLLARNFDDPDLGGCCGQVVVRNCSSVITRLQALEYHLLNGLLRQAQSAFGMVLVAPGPLSMFRRSVLEEVWRTWGSAQELPITKPGRRVYGPWEDDTFAEDADLTLNVLLTGRGVIYEPLAISRTSAPDWTFRLLNQRYRWTRGNYQAATKAWKRWHQAEHPRRLLPLWLGTFLIESLVWPAANLLGLLAFLGVTILFGIHASAVLWLLVLIAIDVNEAAFSARLERADFRLLGVSLLGRVYYNVLLDVNKVFALLDEFRGKKMRWS